MVSDTILVGLLALFSGVVGYSLQYVFSIKSKSKSKESQMNLKTEAYADFVRSVAGIARSPENSKENESYNILLTDAKARIAIYGGKEVVKLLAIFFDGRAILDNLESINSFTNAIQAMRRESLPSDQSVLDEEIKSLLFK